jgi:hypothetical protein
VPIGAQEVEYGLCFVIAATETAGMNSLQSITEHHAILLTKISCMSALLLQHFIFSYIEAITITTGGHAVA